MGDEGANPLPVTIIEVSTVPDVLLKLKLVPMLKIPDAVPPVFVAETVFAPDGDDGTVNFVVKLPSVFEVTVPTVSALNLT